jgi:prepilin-type N-terminal cleavage/methylation domain-containing protein
MARDPLRRGRRRDERGFSLAEVVVAMAVLGIGAAAALTTFVAGTRAVRDVTLRTAAANLLSRQIESARAVRTIDVADGRQVTTQVASGTTFTITQDVTYIDPSSSTTLCAGTGNTLAYKLISVTVTWPNMGSTRPVRGDTLRAVGLGSSGFASGTGTLAVLVAGASGTPVPGIRVTLTPGGAAQTTGSDGCAVFPALTPGSYSASVSATGYVGTANTTATSVDNLGVVAQSVRRGTIYYDTARDVDVVLAAPVGSVLPSGLSLRVGDTYTPETSLPACPVAGAACSTGVPGHVSGLFPEVWTVSASSCTDTPRSSASVDLRGDTPPTSVTVPVGTVAVDVRLAGVPQAGRTVTATRAPSAACPAGETLTLAATTAGTTSLVLPYGSWTLHTANDVADIPVVLTPTTPTGVASLVVTS